jgi:hypothetical protein
MRDRLIELINNNGSSVLTANDFEELADYLLENGVIVPPCKVGDVVYVNPKTWSGLTPLNYDNCFIHSEYFLVAEVVSIIKTRKQNLIKLKAYNRTTYTPEYSRYPISSIGKTVFLTREGVIKALKGGAEE